jgi:hypothetical protein
MLIVGRAVAGAGASALFSGGESSSFGINQFSKLCFQE